MEFESHQSRAWFFLRIKWSDNWEKVSKIHCGTRECLSEMCKNLLLSLIQSISWFSTTKLTNCLSLRCYLTSTPRLITFAFKKILSSFHVKTWSTWGPFQSYVSILCMVWYMKWVTCLVHVRLELSYQQTWWKAWKNTWSALLQMSSHQSMMLTRRRSCLCSIIRFLFMKHK